ncbi:MAG TPA: hypothetical protein PLC87_00780 [Bacteroidales bacterium]|nr:hypothetical protein [Bacteroidales bacterium]HOL97365.1 hypothetical protein [Bacteroidales bacterium]HUM31700.1 hypothetical protein [Bacteroidales bacterium]
MKKFGIFSLILVAVMFISAQKIYSSNRFDDDTIRIKTKNNNEIVIIVNSINNIDQLNSDFDDVMNNLEKVFIRLEEELEGLDSVITMSVKNVDKNIVVELEGIKESKPKNINFEVNVDSKKKQKNLHFLGTFDFGANNYMENFAFPSDFNAQYTVKPWGSWYMGFGWGLRYYVAKPISFDVGVDFSWYNFKYQDKATRVGMNDDGVFFTKVVINTKFYKSKTTVPYVNVSFTPMVHFGEKNYGANRTMFRIGVGVCAGYRLGGYVKYEFATDDGPTIKFKNKNHYYLNSYRYGVKVLFGVSDVNIFATYDLNNLYAKDKGPSLNPIVIGLNYTF